MNPFSQIGAKTTRSWINRWIWWSISSRFLRSISWSWAWKRVSSSGIEP